MFEITSSPIQNPTRSKSEYVGEKCKICCFQKSEKVSKSARSMYPVSVKIASIDQYTLQKTLCNILNAHDLKTLRILKIHEEGIA